MVALLVCASPFVFYLFVYLACRVSLTASAPISKRRSAPCVFGAALARAKESNEREQFYCSLRLLLQYAFPFSYVVVFKQTRMIRGTLTKDEEASLYNTLCKKSVHFIKNILCDISKDLILRGN